MHKARVGTFQLLMRKNVCAYKVRFTIPCESWWTVLLDCGNAAVFYGGKLELCRFIDCVFIIILCLGFLWV